MTGADAFTCHWGEPSVTRQAALFIVLEHLEHCSGTVLNASYLRVTQTRIFLLFGIFTFYIFHFMSKNYLISCASSFFTYFVTYVCILTLNRQTIPCNWLIDKPTTSTMATPSVLLKPRVSSVCSYSKVGTARTVTLPCSGPFHYCRECRNGRYFWDSTVQNSV